MPASDDGGRALTRQRSPFTVLAAGIGFTVAAAVVAAALAPPDAVQGQWQRLMYLHVPAAWSAYCCFVIVLVMSVRYLLVGPGTSDLWSRAATEVGVVATAVTLVSGSIWGRAVWGVWWAWDARLVSTALMLVLYLGCLAVRSASAEADRAARRAAWAGVLVAPVLPLVHFSVVWWSTLHQQATIMAPPRQLPPIEPRMALALSLSVVAVSGVALLGVTLRVQRLAAKAAGRSVSADTAPATRSLPAAAPDPAPR